MVRVMDSIERKETIGIIEFDGQIYIRAGVRYSELGSMTRLKVRRRVSLGSEVGKNQQNG